MKKSFLTIISFCLLFNLFAQDVDQWRGPNRDGIYPETDLLKAWPEAGPELLWHFDELGDGHSSVAITDDALYSAGADSLYGYVIALNHSGELLWKSNYGDEFIESYPGSRSTPLFLDDKLYMMSGMGKLFCMDAKDGKILWEVSLIEKYGAINIKWGVTENLAFLDDKIFCTPGGEEHNVIAVNKDSGELKWSCEGNGEITAYCSPNIVNHNGIQMLITQTKESILGIDALTGALLWSHPWPNKWSVHANTPYYRDGMVYCVSGYGKGGVMVQLADDGKSATEIWREENLDGRMGSFIILDDYIYGPADQGLKWYGLNWETGETVFGESIIKKGNITSADGMLYLYGEDGKVVLAEPVDGTMVEKGRFKVPYGEDQHWAFPVFKDKKMYLRHGTSLMVYNLAAE